MKEVHFVAQGKGGVGKSTISAFLADYLKNKSEMPLHCFDTDPVNPTFSRFQGLKPEIINIMTESNNIDSRFFDGLIEKLVTLDGIAVIDNGAATFVPLMSYMAENDVPSFLSDNGVRMVIHVPLAGGLALEDCLVGLTKTLKSMNADIVVWLNDFQGSIEYKGKTFTEFKLYSENQNRIIGIVHIPLRNPDTFGADIREMTTQSLTLTEAQSPDSSFGIMPRQRIKTVQKGLYEQLDKIPFLATQNGAGDDEA